MLNVVKKWQSVLVVVVLFASSFSLLASSVPTSMSDIEDGSYDTPLGTIEDSSDMSKIQPSLSSKIYDQQKGMVKIIVPTLDVSELYRLLNGYRYQGLIGDRVGSSKELAVPTLEVPISLVTQIASLDSVIGVYEYPSSISKDRLLESMFDGENSDGLYGIPGEDPMSVYDAKHHNLELAWADGYTGDGVIVGMPDSGVDFGHPDLRGTQARVPALPAKVTSETVVALAEAGQVNASLAHGNVIPTSETIYLNETPTTEFTIDYATGDLTFTTALTYNVTVTADYQYNSPYVGWPMAFDPVSLGTYLDTGRANGTWYVNTSYNTTAITTPADVVIDSPAEWDTYLEIVNETVYGPAEGDGTERVFDLKYENIVVGTSALYIKNDTIWKKLTVSTDYFLFATGQIRLQKGGALGDDGAMDEGWSLYAYYNYTNPNINEVLAGVPTPSIGGTPETMVVSGLTPGAQYAFAIKTKDEASNIGLISNSPMSTSGSDSVPPSGIVDLTVEASEDHSSVLMNWTAPGDDGNVIGTTVTEYIVKYSTLPIKNRVCFDYIEPQYTFTIDGGLAAGGSESRVVSGSDELKLEPGKRYYFAIVAVDEAGNRGELSNCPPPVYVKNDMYPPAAITDLTATTGLQHREVDLTWTAPGDDGADGTANFYLVKYSTSPITTQAEFYDATGIGNVLVPKLGGNIEALTVKTSVEGMTYYFAIEAVDETGQQAMLSSGPNSAVSMDDITAPGQISDLNAVPGPNHASIRLFWNATGDDAAVGNATKYIIKYLNPYINNESIVPTSDHQTNFFLDYDNLNTTSQNNTLYYYNETTGWHKMNNTGPAQIGNYNYTIDNATGNVTLLGWNLSKSFDFEDRVYAYYNVTIRHDSGINNETIVPTSKNQTSFFLDYNNLNTSSQNTLYFYNTTTGWLKMNNTGPAQTGKYNYTIDNSTGKVTLLDWSLNNTLNDRVYAYYNATIMHDKTSIYKQLLVDTWTPKQNGDAEEFVLDSLIGGQILPNTQYYFWVEAVDDGGNEGTFPAASASATSTEDTIAPEAINVFTTVVADDHGKIILNWTAPHEDGGIGGACKQYVIKHSENPITNETLFAAAAILENYIVPAAPGTLESYVFGPSFAPGTTLYFAIKGVDDAGSYGPLGAGLNVLGVLRDDTTAPSKISDLAATTADNDGEIILTWDAPGDDGATGTASSYIIKYREVVPEYKEVAFEKKQFGVINPTYEDVMYNVTGIPTLDGVYRLGIHPDPNLALANGNTEMVPPIYNYSRVLLVKDPSGFDMVYVDLNFDQDFSDEKPCFFGDECAWAEWVNEKGDDEFRSGGMMYFISDGTTPIPYSDVYCDRYGLDNVIPGNDEMVCFFGEFTEGAIGGTERASVIVGQGRLESDLADPDLHSQAICQGIAPEAKIMAVTNSMFDGWYFTVEGYDGTPGTGDEAQIVSSGASIDVYENGWDFYSKFLDWLTYIYSDGRTTFVAGAGDTPGGGYGFGTMNAPGASPAVITAGSGIDYYYRTGLTEPAPAGQKYDGGASPGHGDIYPTSSRGPTMAGDPKPDIIATGAFTVSSTPINSGTGSDIWMGPGLASATASGILALVHDAYFEATHTARKETVLNASMNTTEVQLYHRPVVDDGSLTVWIDGDLTTAFSLDAQTGIITFDSNVTVGEVVTATYDFIDQFPDVESGRSILMSGADDMNYDPMSQGAGYCNAAESTKIAATTGGARVTPSRWTPGDYKGTLYDYFIKLYSPETKEENMKKEFTIENYDSFDIDARVHAGVMEKTGETLFIVQTTKDVTSSWTVMNSNGICDRDGNILASIDSTLWENAGLLKITASSDATEMDINDDGVIDLSYALEVHDWTDRWDLGLSGLFDGDISPDTYAGGEGYHERNRFTSHFPERSGEGLYATIYDPANRSADGLLIWVRGLTGGDVTWYVKCEFYEKADLMSSEPNVKFYEDDGTTTLPSQISVAPGEAYNFIAEMVVPPGTRPGTYECAIYVDKVRTVTDEVAIETTKGGETVVWLDNKNLIDCTVNISGNVIATTKDAPWETVIDSAYEGQSDVRGDEGLNFDNVVPGSENVEKINDYIYEPVNIINSTHAQLAYGNVIDLNELTKNGTLNADNETVYGPSAGGETGPYNLNNGDIENCTLYADINGEWVKLSEGDNYTLDYATGEISDVFIRQAPAVVNETLHTISAAEDGIDITFFTDYTSLLNFDMYWEIDGEWEIMTEGGDYVIDLATGQIDTIWGGEGEGMTFYGFYNHSALIPGITLHAYYNFSYSGNKLADPTDYSIDNETGVIYLDIPLLPADTIVANYSAGEVFELNVDYSINHEGGDLRFTVPNIIDNESYIFPLILPDDDPVWPSNHSLNLNHGNILNCTLYFKNETVGWQEMTLSSAPTNISQGYYNYTIDYESGEVEFAKVFIEDENEDLIPYATWNLTAGDEIYAYYNYTALKLDDTIRSSYSYYSYVVDYKAGKITFTEALGKDDTINVTYTYKTTTTIPIVLNVAANDPKFEFGGDNTFDISNEDVLTAIGGETSVWLTYNNIVDGDIYNNGDMIDAYGEIPRMEILNNTNSVAGEIVLVAEGGEIRANLTHAGDLDEAIAPASLSLPEPFAIYFNGTKLNGSARGDKYGDSTMDYILDLTTGELYFCPDRIEYENLIDNAIGGENTFLLDNTNIIWTDLTLFNISDGLTQMSISSEPTNLTTGDLNYTYDYATGVISLSGDWSLTAGDNLSAMYDYTNWLQGLPYMANITADYYYFDPTIQDFQLPHASIIPYSYMLWNHGLEYSQLNYNVDLKTGMISFNEPVGLAVIEATYSYGHYTLDKITGEISFNLLSEAFDETFVPTEEVDKVSLNYGKIFNSTFFVWDDIVRLIEDEIVNISALESEGHVENGYLLNYTLYYTNETFVQHLMTYSSTPSNSTLGYYNYTIDNRTGNVTLSDNWTMGSDANESINAYYNYTEIDWQRLIPKTDEGKYYYELDSENGTLSFNNWSLEVKYVDTNDWNISVTNTIKAFYNYTGLAPNDVITADYQYRDGNKRLFSTDAVYGGGDWRFYYVEIPDGGLNKDPLTKFFVNLTWDNKLADIDVITFGPGIMGNLAPGNYDFPSERYGPHTLQNNGGSTETAAFFTATGGPQEYAMSDLSPGLNVIGLHSTLLTASNFESVRGEVGNIKISTDEVKVVSNEYSGNFNISTVCSLDWQGELGGVAAGPSAPESYSDMLVYQDEDDWTLFDTFEEQLASGNTSVYVTLKDCLIFDVHIYGHREHGFKDLDDLDLGIFLDENGDGITQTDEFVAMDADWDADEHVKLIAPKDGDYIIRTFGFTLKTIPAHYDIDITIVQGLGFAVDGKGEDTAPDENNIFSSDTKLPAFTTGEVALSWDLAGVKEGVPLMGAMYVGPGNGPMTFLMAIDLGFDFTQPTVSGLTPSEGEVVKEKMPLIGLTFEDFDRGELVASTMEIYLDGNRITAQSSINVPFDDENAGGGFPMGTISYVLPGPLDDGVHIVEASCADLAGNAVESTWSFTIDTGSPSLSIYEPSEEVSYANSDNFVITGEFEIDTTLAIMGTNVNKLVESPDGTFRAEITLESGKNSIVISATDTAGNKAEIKRTVVLDTDMPVFEGFTSLEGSRTNKDKVTITGEMSETGTMTINSKEINVNSDGSFSTVVSLREGDNMLHLIFTDHAGNSVHDWLNITLDQTLPKIVIDDLPTEVSSNNFTFSAQIIEDELKVGGVLVNGKQVTVNATRGVSEFDRTVFLSYGLNTIVIEAKDKAGNVVELRHTVEYAPDYGTNNAAIGMMILLMIVGLIVGLFIAMVLWKEKPEPVEAEETPPEEEAVPEEGAEVVDGEEIPEGEVPPEGEEMPVPEEDIPDEDMPEMDEEDMTSEEIGDDIPDEDIPDEDIPDEDIPDEEMADEEMPEMDEDELSMPEEDMTSEEIGDDLPDEDITDEGEPVILDDVEEAPPDESMDISDEAIEPEPEMEDVESEPEVEASEPDTEAEVEEISEEPEAETDTEPMEEAEAPEEDDRIQRLRQAFEDGKISEELYKKNLAKLKGE